MAFRSFSYRIIFHLNSLKQDVLYSPNSHHFSRTLSKLHWVSLVYFNFAFLALCPLAVKPGGTANLRKFQSFSQFSRTITHRCLQRYKLQLTKSYQMSIYTTQHESRTIEVSADSRHYILLETPYMFILIRGKPSLWYKFPRSPRRGLQSVYVDALVGICKKQSTHQSPNRKMRTQSHIHTGIIYNLYSNWHRLEYVIKHKI